MRRGLFSFSAVLSLLLCAAAVAFWIRSYDLRLAFNDRLTVRSLEVYSYAGKVIVVSRQKATTSKTVVTTAPDGSQVVAVNVHASKPAHRVVIPYVMIAVIAAGLPLGWLVYFSRRARRWRLRRAGKCPVCGYNLTGNTSGVCPECGSAVLP